MPAESNHLQWPHGPVHWVYEPGIYMVTAGTYTKIPYFNTDARRDVLLKMLTDVTKEFGWRLQAWAVMANHYHFVASTERPERLGKMLGKLHASSARQINREDATPGRRIWFQYWDSHITHEASWLARLHYVHTNPVHHGSATCAEEYRWCSAHAFSCDPNRSFVATVSRMKTNTLSVVDDF
jgi:putative transposase